MTTRKTVRLAPLLLALALTIPAAGCDWLDPSGSSSRLSPVIGALAIAPPSVFCDAPFDIAFDYADPQDDMDQILLSFRHTLLDERLSRTVSWGDPDLDLTNPGRASYAEFFFGCGGASTGDWTVTVQLEDRRGHLSNELQGTVTLISSR